MATMGRYCKAYPIARFREFPAWREHAGNTRPEKAQGRDAETPRVLNDADCLYLQENLVVTDGIHRDRYVVFDEITPEWEAFCRDQLQFEVEGNS
jgi:hypothetical protein